MYFAGGYLLPEARQLIDTIDTTIVIGLRDRALIGLMVCSFARIGTAFWRQSQLKSHA